MGMGCVPGLGKWEYLASKIIKGCSQVSFIAGGNFVSRVNLFIQEMPNCTPLISTNHVILERLKSKVRGVQLQEQELL